jgi:hypothetical protein
MRSGMGVGELSGQGVLPLNIGCTVPPRKWMLPFLGLFLPREDASAGRSAAVGFRRSSALGMTGL